MKRIWEKGRLSFFICSACFIYLSRFTWFKWGDLIVDVGREMYVPLQLSLSRLLYRDIFYTYGPFSPYFNSLLFRLFGANLYSLVLSGVMTTSAVSVLIYKISRRFLDVFSSTFAVIGFLFVFAFGHYVYYGNYNFILPYNYSVIHAIAFSLAAFYFFYTWLKKRSDRYLYITSLFIFLTAISRIDIGIMLIISVVTGLITRRKIMIMVFLPLFFSVVIYTLVLKTAAVERGALLDIWIKSTLVKYAFTKWLSGADEVSQNIFVMIKNALYYLFLCVFFMTGGWIFGRFWSLKSMSKRYFLSSLFTAGLISVGIILYRKSFTYDLQFRSLPIICIIVIIVAIVRIIKKRDTAENVYIMAFACFSLLLMSRMLLRVWAGHYGFYILAPGMFIYYLFFLKMLPAVLNSEIPRRFFKAGLIVIFILFIRDHFLISRSCYDNRSLKIPSGRGAIYVFNNDREIRCRQLLEFLNENTNPGDTLVVFPEGVTINFLSQRENPLYYYSYLPVDLSRRYVLDDIIHKMEEEAVDYVALVQRDAAEYGYSIFGKDYGVDLMSYVLENYTLYKQFGPFPFTTEQYGIALFKRKT